MNEESSDDNFATEKDADFDCSNSSDENFKFEKRSIEKNVSNSKNKTVDNGYCDSNFVSENNLEFCNTVNDFNNDISTNENEIHDSIFETDIEEYGTNCVSDSDTHKNVKTITFCENSQLGNNVFHLNSKTLINCGDQSLYPPTALCSQINNLKTQLSPFFCLKQKLENNEFSMFPKVSISNILENYGSFQNKIVPLIITSVVAFCRNCNEAIVLLKDEDGKNSEMPAIIPGYIIKEHPNLLTIGSILVLLNVRFDKIFRKTVFIITSKSLSEIYVLDSPSSYKKIFSQNTLKEFKKFETEGKMKEMTPNENAKEIYKSSITDIDDLFSDDDMF